MRKVVEKPLGNDAIQRRDTLDEANLKEDKGRAEYMYETSHRSEYTSR